MIPSPHQIAIGNYFTYKGEIVQVDQILRQNKTYFIRSTCGREILVNCLEPIEVILEHLQESPNLKYNEENEAFISVDEPDVNMDINIHGVYLYVCAQMVGLYKYVHEFQNAYLWNTKKLLEIKL